MRGNDNRRELLSPMAPMMLHQMQLSHQQHLHQHHQQGTMMVFVLPNNQFVPSASSSSAVVVQQKNNKRQKDDDDDDNEVVENLQKTVKNRKTISSSPSKTKTNSREQRQLPADFDDRMRSKAADIFKQRLSSECIDQLIAISRSIVSLRRALQVGQFISAVLRSRLFDHVIVRYRRATMNRVRIADAKLWLDICAFVLNS